MIATEPAVTPIHPPAPATLQEAGLTLDLVLPLVLKTLHFAGELRGVELAQRLGISFNLLDSSLELLKRQRDVEVVGGALVGEPSYMYRISSQGRARALAYLEENHYVGYAPVPLAQYRRYMEEWRRTVIRRTTREQVREAFQDLVLPDSVMDQLGPAVNGAHSIFIYGAPGNGKTVISQSIRKLMPGTIAIPHALEVEGSIIRFFDPINHEEVPLPDEPDDYLGVKADCRWVRCRRPMVMVGGELTMNALELTYSTYGKFYRAPIQAVANGGLLLIDDFGRQHCSPQDLLNRWMVPLEGGVDHLMLQTGQKFEMPFQALIVFATNLRPSELVDEAFLRRIQYKIFSMSPSIEEFLKIFENYCRDKNIAFDREMVEQLLQNYYGPRRLPLRGCQPRDLINQALSMAEYLGRPRQLTLDLMEAACDGYFVDDRETPAVYV